MRNRERRKGCRAAPSHRPGNWRQSGSCRGPTGSLDAGPADPPGSFCPIAAQVPRRKRLQDKSHIHLHLIMQTMQGGAVVIRASFEELPQNALIFYNGGETEGNDRGLGKNRVENPIKSGEDFRGGLVRHGRAEIGKETAQCGNIDAADRLSVHAERRDVELALLLRYPVCKNGSLIAERHWLAACPSIRPRGICPGSIRARRQGSFRHVAQRRLDGSYNQIQTEINQVDSRQGKHQIAANDDAGVQQVIDQIQKREIGGILIVDQYNFGGLLVIDRSTIAHRLVVDC